MKKRINVSYFVATIFLFIIFIICFSVFLRFFTRNILVGRFNYSNSFTNIVFFDNRELISNINSENTKEENEEIDNSYSEIRWDELYPFENGNEQSLIDNDIDKIKKAITSLEERIEAYSSKYLVGYTFLTEKARKYEKIIHWNIVDYAEYNGIIEVTDNYFSTPYSKIDISLLANSTIEFAKFCCENNVDFLFVQQPYKICKIEDSDISGSTDFSNQNADAFLIELNNAGIETYDTREDIHDEDLNHHDLFFNTDHHWKPNSGLWSAQHVLKYINEKFDYNFDYSQLREDYYIKENYPEWFLGSQGKKVTLSVAKPDDISLYHPTFETSFNMSIPSKGINISGPFEIMYDMERITTKDYYGQSPYHTYAYGDQPLIKLENNLTKNDSKVLFIHDSFGDVETPFLSLGVKYLDTIDLRHFNGSIRNYIIQTNPDIVIVAYSPSQFTESINYSYHNNLFDFS